MTARTEVFAARPGIGRARATLWPGHGWRADWRLIRRGHPSASGDLPGVYETHTEALDAARSHVEQTAHLGRQEKSEKTGKNLSGEVGTTHTPAAYSDLRLSTGGH